MNAAELMQRLESLSNPSVKKQYGKDGAGDNFFGVTSGDLTKLAKEIKRNHPLALELWATENQDARMLATLIADHKQLTEQDFDTLLRSTDYPRVVEWLVKNVVASSPLRTNLRPKWMDDPHPMIRRAGWILTAPLVKKDPTQLDLPALLDRIDAEIAAAPEPVQWPMNHTLTEIGINNPDLRDRAIKIGEKHKVLIDYPVSKGCVSPYAPLWITEMVTRLGK